jgi:hypothetical protein
MDFAVAMPVGTDVCLSELSPHAQTVPSFLQRDGEFVSGGNRRDIGQAIRHAAFAFGGIAPPHDGSVSLESQRVRASRCHGHHAGELIGRLQDIVSRCAPGHHGACGCQCQNVSKASGERRDRAHVGGLCRGGEISTPDRNCSVLFQMLRWLRLQPPLGWPWRGAAPQ